MDSNVRQNSKPCKHVFEHVGIVAIGTAYKHTIEIFSRGRLSVEMKNAIRNVTQGKIWDEFVTWGWKTFVNSPTRETVEVLEEYWSPRFSICALHIGFDFDPTPGITRAMLVELIDNHFHLKGNRDRPFLFKGTRYSTDIRARREKGQTRPAKIATSYHDKPGKLDGEVDKPRYEIRFEKGHVIKRMGILSPIDLLEINPADLFRKNVTVRDHGERLIRETIRTTRPTPYIDVPTRVRVLMQKSGMGSLTEWKRRKGKKHFGRLVDRTDIIDIKPTLEFFPSKRREGGVPELLMYHKVSNDA